MTTPIHFGQLHQLAFSPADASRCEKVRAAACFKTNEEDGSAPAYVFSPNLEDPQPEYFIATDTYDGGQRATEIDPATFNHGIDAFLSLTWPDELKQSMLRVINAQFLPIPKSHPAQIPDVENRTASYLLGIQTAWEAAKGMTNARCGQFAPGHPDNFGMELIGDLPLTKYPYELATFPVPQFVQPAAVIHHPSNTTVTEAATVH